MDTLFKMLAKLAWGMRGYPNKIVKCAGSDQQARILVDASPSSRSRRKSHFRLETAAHGPKGKAARRVGLNNR